MKPASQKSQPPIRKPADNGLLRILEEISAEFGRPAAPPSTPLMILPVDTHRLTAFWNTPEPEETPGPAGASTEERVLRFSESGDSDNPNRFDVSVNPGVQYQTVPVWRPGGTYTVELGEKRGELFYSLAEFHELILPRAFPVSGAETAALPPPPPLLTGNVAPGAGEQELDELICRCLAGMPAPADDPVYATDLFGPCGAPGSSSRVTSSTQSSAA